MAGKQPRRGDIERWREFANQYIIDFNGTAAIERCAGYTVKGQAAAARASNLLSNVTVQEFIQEASEARMKRLELEQDKVILEMLRVGMSDVKNYAKWDKDGLVVKPSEDLTENESRALNSVELIENFDNEGMIKSRRFKFSLHNKTTALEQLAKHLGMYTEKREVEHKFGVMKAPPNATPSEWLSAVREEMTDAGDGDS